MVMCLLTTSISTSYAAGAYRVGDQGAEIAEIQGKLAVLGYDVMADGAFGPAMVDAIKEFQKSQGMKADGMIGPATYSEGNARNNSRRKLHFSQNYFKRNGLSRRSLRLRRH